MITQPAPNKETIYQISYPRSGKSWFSYCVNNVVDFGGSIDHAQAHYLVPHEGNEKYNIKGHFDLYCVFLLRDYKEALISNFPFGNSPLHLAKYMWTRESHVPVKEEMRLLSRSTVENASIDALLHHMMMMAKEPSASTGHFAKTSEFEKLFYELFYLLGEEHCESLTFTEFLLEHARFPRFDPYRKRNLIESIHQDKPFNQIMEAQHNGQSIVENSVEIRTFSSPIYHYYLAVQLERYYTLLEYYDRVRTNNSKQAFLVRYEELIIAPNTVLSKFIDFLRCNNLVDSHGEKTARQNLKLFIENLDFHRDKSIKIYKKEQTNNGHSSQTDDPRFHSRNCSPIFLQQLTNALKKKNPDLFDKYLKSYER
jgi:hypothetical protein